MALPWAASRLPLRGGNAPIIPHSLENPLRCHGLRVDCPGRKRFDYPKCGNESWVDLMQLSVKMGDAA